MALKKLDNISHTYKRELKKESVRHFKSIPLETDYLEHYRFLKFNLKALLVDMVKDLHLASCLEELVKKSEVTIPKSTTLSGALERMKKMHDKARKADRDEDQELEYMCLHRYFILFTYARKFPEFTKEKHHSLSLSENLKKYETIGDALKKRYDDKKFKEFKNHTKFSPKPISSPTHEKTLKDLTNHKTAGKLSKTTISSQELFAMSNSKNNNKESYIIIDARSSHDFKESHLNMQNVINIPEEDIIPGLSASALTKVLPLETREQWNKRGNVNKLIILDWHSTEGTLTKNSKLYLLREIMLKWDLSTSYKSHPLILEGGYEDILLKYPHITTNPKVHPPLTNDSSIKLPPESLVEYPTNILEPEEEKKPEPKPSPKKILPDTKSLIVDRSTKPAVPKEESELKIKEEIFYSDKKADETIEDNLGSTTPSPEESSEIISQNESERSVKEESVEIVDTKPIPKPDPKQVLDELRKVKPDIPVRPQSTETMKSGDEESTVAKSKSEKEPYSPSQRCFPENKTGEGTYRIPLKINDGSSGGGGGILKRSSSSPNIAKMDDETCMRIPSFTRTNKPVVYAERADSTYGKTAAGLTGLKNFANNCYMNSILQCLSNTRALVKELISINRSLAVNPQSKTKGRVAQEVISAFRSMWSGDVRVYSIKELKNLLGSLKEIFNGTGHQDSNEFLIILLEYLHDDLNIPAEGECRLDGAREETGEKAWGEFRRKNCSIIQRLFYGQHRSTVTCSTCGHSSVTFEQFFNLFVPIPSKDASVTLNDCIQLYMSGERISGWKCPKCKDERNATKKFDISRLPPILVIALKRFTHEEDSWLQKKENLVTYPLEGLDMERFIVKGSEQRYTKYNLYAMSTHTGTLRAGHYKAICKNYLTEKWYMFDDQSVDPLPAHSVRNNAEVYILFYNAIPNC